ncbi:diversity-generating retroelement protein Avd [Sphaerotilus sp.]|uniref:diversity-generating retroelement protein Avd n=1 Tax=Sphaerotilus sp. TaxID=2093942 RepID=UPI002ACE43A3|nr:diversity-generating retroelement protein Avd [Sphaerotilus sp.]MDZ7855455.1 diversity-generating retroelement protein Avd [Sphaerotilus sp.]
MQSNTNDGQDSSGGPGAAPPRDSRPRRTPFGKQERPQNPARTTGPALEAMYQFTLWLIPTLEKFPRSQKFLLGDRLQTEALAVLDRLIDATYSRERQQHLRAANLGLEKMRFGVRLAKDLKHLDLKSYAHAARTLDEVGRMVGGWLKADRSTGMVPAQEAAHGAPA